MNHKYRTRIQGESLQVKIRDYEFKITEQMMLPAFFCRIDIICVVCLLCGSKDRPVLRSCIFNNYTFVSDSCIC